MVFSLSMAKAKYVVAGAKNDHVIVRGGLNWEKGPVAAAVEEEARDAITGLCYVFVPPNRLI